MMQSPPLPPAEQDPEHLLLRAIAEIIPDSIYVKDLEGRMLFANRACLDLIRLPREAVIGKRDDEWHPDPVEAARFMANDQAVMRSGRTAYVEEPMTTAPGMQRIFLSTKAAMRDASGAVTGLIGISTDITARKRGEAALERSERRFRAAVRAMEGVLWTADSEGRFGDDQAAWSRLTGQEPEAYRGLGWLDAIHPDDALEAREAWLGAVAERRPFVSEHRLRRRDGGWCTCAVRAIPVEGPMNEVVEWVGVHTDVSQERATQFRLAEAIEQLSLALDIGEIGVWSFDPEGERLEWDDRMRSLFGIEPAADIDMTSFMEGIHEEDRLTFQEHFRVAREAGVGAVFELEFRIRRRVDGKIRWLTARGQQLPFGGGSGGRIIGTTRDVTSRREREEQVHGLLRELSHRTKNILAVIQAIARQMATTSRDPAQFRTRFEARLQAMSRALDLLVERHWHGATIHDVVRSQLAEDVDRVAHSGPVLFLKPDAAQNLGLALHELGTNAASYGALSTDAGHVELDWRVENGEFTLRWREIGGPPVEPPKVKGFGQTLMQRLALGGSSSLDFRPDGVVWEMTAPIAHVVGTPP